MSAKISADERSFENINDPHRPTVVCDAFKHLCSYAWLNAKTELDEKFSKSRSEGWKCTLLTTILLEASELSIREIEGFYRKLNEIRDGSVVTAKKGSASSDVPADISTSVTRYLKSGIETVDVRYMQENVKTAIQSSDEFKKATTDSIFKGKHMQTYLAEACKIAWKMAVQLPPMRMNCLEDKFNEKLHEPYMGSADPKKSSHINYYVFPVVRHGELVVVKGKVILG